MSISRRTLLQLAGVAPLTSTFGFSIASADDKIFRHALTLFDDIKYGPDFKQFDYVNPQAPKGGKLRLAAAGSFDSMNPYTFKGDSIAVTGNETLLTSSLDEPSTEYGLVAESMWFPGDWSSVVYRLRPEARFHDGKPMTVEDVIWSMTTLKETHPQYNSYYKNVVKTEKTGDHEVTFTFSEKGNRELPLITGQLPVLPQHWWTGKDANGKQRNIAEATMEIPLGSGPYKVTDVKSGASVRLVRVEDYWGKDLPVNIGQNNFDQIDYSFYRDSNVLLEALKGNQYDYRAENSAKNWATGYNSPAVKDGRIIKEEIRLKQGKGMQCFALNLRRAKFQDVRVRQALNHAFDFEWSNTNLFYGQYKRTRSYFSNSVMEAKGLPSPDELRRLEPLRDKLPPEVFTTEYTNPVNSNGTERRKNLRMASKLLAEAGWNVTQDGNRSVLKNASGDKLEFEILIDDPVFERIVLPYQQQLELLGIDVSIKTIDTAQYQRRVETFDFDVIVGGWGQSLSPGNEQRGYFGSDSADRNGSQNYCGIKNPAIDTLINQIIFATDRAALTGACMAMDRVLMWNHYVVPMYHIAVERIARWDRFGKPDKLPEYAVGFPTIWWWDAERAAKVAKG
jgi:microcin C transport system substrate-binding protein